MYMCNKIIGLWKSTKELFQKSSSRKRKRDEERDIDNEESNLGCPSKAKRTRQNVFDYIDNEPVAVVNGDSSHRRVVFPSGGSNRHQHEAKCSTTAARHPDISDDDSDIEFLEESHRHFAVSRPVVTYPDVEIISESLTPLTRYKRNNQISRRTQAGLTFDHYARLLEQCTPINRRSFVQNAYRTLPFASEPRQQNMRSVLLNGPRQFLHSSSTSRRPGGAQQKIIRNNNHPIVGPTWYQKGIANTKANLQIRESVPPSTLNWRHLFVDDNPSSSSNHNNVHEGRYDDDVVYLSAGGEPSSTTVRLGSVGSNRSSGTLLDGQDGGRESSSERVSVAETTSSIASVSQIESHQKSNPPKRCTSLETFDELLSRSPLIDLTQKFTHRDPKLLIKSAASRAADKARRDEIAKNLFGEKELRRSARTARHKSAEDNVRLRMRLEGLLIEDKELVVEEEFIELTQKQLAAVKRALGPGRPDEVLVEGFGTQITRRDIQTLDKLNWLNDEVINFFMNLIVERGGKDQSLPKVYAMITFFYPKLIQSGHSALKRWTKKVDIFSYDLIVVPVHLGIHWCLAVIDMKQKSISYYDSMGGANDECLEALLNYLQDECRDKKKKAFDVSGWGLYHEVNIPKQRNGSDCGMFACRFAECISRNATITFTQDHMPYFRRRTVYEILNKCLLQSVD